MSEDTPSAETGTQTGEETSPDESVGSEVEGTTKASTGEEPKDVLDSLDLSRGEVTDDDITTLEDAIGALDFAARQASKEHVTQLHALAARLQDVIGQIERGERTARADHVVLNEEQEARYQSLIDEGVEAGQGRDLEEAQRLLEEAVRLNPSGIDGLFNLGVVYGLLAHLNISRAEFYDDYTRDEIYLEKARICYDTVLDQEPVHLPSLNNLATLYSMREDRQTAIAYLERVIAADPQTDVERHLVAEAQSQLSELRSF